MITKKLEKNQSKQIKINPIVFYKKKIVNKNVLSPYYNLSLRNMQNIWTHLES